MDYHLSRFALKYVLNENGCRLMPVISAHPEWLKKNWFHGTVKAQKKFYLSSMAKVPVCAQDPL